MKTYIVGDSHLVAIRRGMPGREMSFDFEMFGLGSAKHANSSFSFVKDGALHFKPEEYREKVESITGSAQILPNATWGILLGTHNASLYGLPQWRQNVPSHLVAPGKRPITANALTAICRRFLEPKLTFFEQLKSVGVDFFIISGPPPRLDHKSIALGTSKEVVLHIDNVTRRVLLDWLADHGIDFIAPPPEALRDDGFLMEQYEQKLNGYGTTDHHHATPEYGALMWRRIEGYLQMRLANLPRSASC